MSRTARAMFLFALAGCSVGCSAQDGRIHALLVTGENNHNWQYTSRFHKDTLEATGRFVVDITDTPGSTLGDAKTLAKYQVVILDYNDSHASKRWGQPAEGAFVEAVRNGLGVVAVHSANNAFKGWAEYEQMVALLWREGTGHGKFHQFDVKIVDAQHPIVAGLPASNTTVDELYHKLVNTHNAPYKLLAQAMSTTESGGSGQNEPMALVKEFGKGRVFATPLGHVWVNAQETKPSVSTPFFKTLLVRGAEWAATGKVTLPAEWKETAVQNTLTDEEKSAGWELLFDGKEAKFRGFKKDHIPKKWTIENGMFKINKGDGEGGDVVTLNQYANFEFSLDWKVTDGANSGVMYRCAEEGKNYPWETGPEMQVLDNAKHQDGKEPRTSAGSLYSVKAIDKDVVRPVGEWNHAKVVCRGTRIEHWMNGFKVVDVDLASEDFKKAKDASKWKGSADYASRSSGFIALQDHGDEVFFRNIKVRRLD